MLAFAYYLLKVIICSLVLYGYYLIFLRNKIYHSYNRFFLLAIVVLSLSLPMLKFSIWHNDTSSQPAMIKLLQVVNNSDEFMDEIIIQSRYQHINKEMISWYLFIGICVLFSLGLVRTLIKISVLKKTSIKQEYDDVILIHTIDKRTPFSFFKNIFWNEAIDINSLNGQRILKHELAHVQEKHSHDKLFLNLTLLVFWSNPVFWLIRRELNMIHEFIADKKAVDDGDTAAFAAMILQATYPSHRFELTNNFFYSPIKRRLSMLTKNKSKVNYISRLLVLPLVALVFAAFTIKAKKTMSTFPKNKMITVVIDAGHGGADHGTSGTDGSYEKDVNLALVKMIRDLNTNDAVKIVLTRETDIYQDPKERAAISNKLQADLFISVHNSAFDKAAATTNSGMEIFVSKSQFVNSEKSKLLASAIIASFQGNYGLAVSKSPQQRQQGIWVLQESKCPAVLIDAGYLSNKNDLAYLTSADGQKQFALNVLNAITVYFNQENNVSNTKELNGNAVDTNPLKASENSGNAVKKMMSNKVADTIVNASQARAISSDDQNTSRKLYQSALPGQPSPLLVLDGRITDMNSLKLIPPDRIEHVNVLKGEQALKTYGEKGKQGVVEITLKPHKPLVLMDTSMVFTKVEQEAEFPGGQPAWTDFLRKNLDAGMPVAEGWKSGTYRIIVEFIVNGDGSVSDVKTSDYPNSKTANACIALIKNGPGWNPAKQNDKIVRAYRKQPITFVVSEQ